MSTLLVCVAQRPDLPASSAGVQQWSALGLELLLLGEWSVAAPAGIGVLAEIETTAADVARLDGLLRHCRALPGPPARLLLLAADALPDQAWSEAVEELAVQFPQGLVCGRGWGSPDRNGPERNGPERLDAPNQPAWLLLPPRLPLPPAELAVRLPAVPDGCLAWCLEQAAALGVAVIDATDVAPLQRQSPAAADPVPSAPGGWPQQPASARRLAAVPPGGPPLSLLLLDAPQPLEASWRQALCTVPSLPWELALGRCAEPAAAWLSRCRGEWIWPFQPGADAGPQQAPDPSLLAAVLAAARAPDVDAISLPGPALPVLRRSWIERWSALPSSRQAALEALNAQGARVLALPLVAVPGATPDQALPPAAAALLVRAELLLARAEQRLLEQAERLARLEAASERP
jgi:hypothetical protein